MALCDLVDEVVDLGPLTDEAVVKIFVLLVQLLDLQVEVFSVRRHWWEGFGASHGVGACVNTLRYHVGVVVQT